MGSLSFALWEAAPNPSDCDLCAASPAKPRNKRERQQSQPAQAQSEERQSLSQALRWHDRFGGFPWQHGIQLLGVLHWLW
mmetsp:Transcript_4796/g.11009  ORF Transcript_4796/g.11009 Transcript_4796/m.11009 type:complete len:80 (+) Transcript_4796:98-337(+)